TDAALVAGTCSAKIAEPYVVVRPAVSSRSLTASRVPSPTAAGVARKMPPAAIGRPYWLLAALRLRGLFRRLHRNAARGAGALSAAIRVTRQGEDVRRCVGLPQ